MDILNQRLILTFLGCLVAVQVGAQTMDVQWSAGSAIEPTTEVRPLGVLGGKYLFAKDEDKNGNQVSLLRFDASLSNPEEVLLFTYADAKSDEKTRLMLLYLNPATKTIDAVLYFVNTKQKASGVRLLRFLETGKPIGAAKDLARNTTEGSVGLLPSADADIIFSDDSNSVAIFHELPNKRPTSPSQLFLKVLSADFNTTHWETTLTLPFTEKDGPVHGVILDNNQQVYIEVGTEFKDLRRINHGITTYYIPTEQGFYRVTPKGELIPVAFDLGKTRIKSMACEADDAGDSRLFTLEGPSNQSQKGDALVVQTWNRETGELTNKKPEPIDYVYDKVPANQRLNFVLTNAHLKRDQGSVVVAEQLEAKKEDVAGSFVQIGIPVWHFFHGAILVFNLNADNSVKWTTLIPKIQHTAGKSQRRYGSFFSMPFQNKLLFFYNDNPENIKDLQYDSQKFVSKAQEMKAAVTIVATIDADGKLSKQAIPGTESASGFTVVASEMVPAGASKLLCVARWNEQFRIGLISVAD
jgi:hypothetical protein